MHEIDTIGRPLHLNVMGWIMVFCIHIEYSFLAVWLLEESIYIYILLLSYADHSIQLK